MLEDVEIDRRTAEPGSKKKTLSRRWHRPILQKERDKVTEEYRICFEENQAYDSRVDEGRRGQAGRKKSIVLWNWA